MELYQNRFIVTVGRDAFDAATTRRVHLRRLPPVALSAELVWQRRCTDRLMAASPPFIRLLDFGIEASGRRFEVMDAQAPRGEPRPRLARTRPPDPAACGQVCRAMAELLDGPSRPGVRRLQLQATGAGMLDDAVLTLARLGRLRGFAPVSYAALDRWPWLGALLLERHVIAFDDTDAPGRARRIPVSLLLGLGVASPRAHVVIETRLRPDLLGLAPPLELAGRLLAPNGRARRAGQGQTGVVREVGGAFGQARAARPASAVARRTRRIHARVRRGVAAAGGGRRAAGLRLLRSAASALSRRGDHEGAAKASLALGCVLREAGAIDKSAVAFAAARDAAEKGELPLDAIRAVVELGLVEIDDGRLGQAEAALRSAMVAAAALGSDSMSARGANALARCLLWQGRHDEAGELLQTAPAPTPRQGVIRVRLQARLALARRDLVVAGGQALTALRLAEQLNDERELAAAHELVAIVRSHTGDRSGMREHVALGLRAAHAARSPVRTWRLRAALLESVTRLSDRATRRLAARFAEAMPATLPGLLRGRLEKALLEAVPDAPAASRWRAEVRTLGRVHGVQMLNGCRTEVSRMEIIEELIEVVGIGQDGDDESTTLRRICGSVRARLEALSVSVQTGPPMRACLAADGRVRSGPSELAARIADTGLVIPPARMAGGGLESGAPVRYEGDVVAALVCHWGSDRAPDPTRVGALLATAAAISAPRVRLALDRLATPTVPAPADGWELIGTSQVANEIRQAIARAAPAPFPTLIVGESGSGKELVARAIHRNGPRRDRRFCALNCAALNDELIESELFGHARGAFSGALHDRTGFFEEADGGSLFLDEVSELSPRGQAKVLRAIQEGEIRRVGENFSRRVDVRLIAATNRDLQGDVESGRFRQDLFYRLDVLRIAVPPLRERVEDVAALAARFWADAARRTGSRATLTPELLAALCRYDWPGNVRELQNVMAALAVDAPARGRVGPQRLPRSMARAAVSESRGTLEEARRTFERRYVQATLAREGWHRGRAAAALGLSRQGFTKALARLSIQPQPPGVRTAE